ncbi:hypothetical protein COLO4_25040 [Corchorus olitorius]|uniref:Uncharacterized protein n=1 Tax=Corchorus olitorius TaxID=93759 RepID=A0A1R3I521_9ROSI|nr:hypothetical protein COLO4_25040 [Corchorus olitorius]
MGNKADFISLSRLRFSHFILLVLLNPCSNLVDCSGEDVKCRDTERQALVVLRQSLTDPSARLSSWVGQDCCTWKGIKCHNQTGHVVKLDLRNPFQLINGGVGDPEAYKRSCLGGKIDSSLLHLEYLTYLDLSLNDFQGLEIPHFFGDLKNLRYLNLSFASFAGEIPPSLGNLSSLQYLDLFADSYSNNGPWELRSSSLKWLETLSSLKYLNLGFTKLDDIGEDWLQIINMLPSLLDLRLHWCHLKSLPLSLPSVNFTSLSVLDLSENSFNSPFFPPWLFNLTALTELYLTWNFFTGSIPAEFANLKNLQVLDLSNNLNLEGEIPGLFANLSKLRILDLSANNFQGNVHEFFNGFSNNKLEFLDLSSNSLSGELPNSLGWLKNLQHLDLSSNSFWGSISSSIGRLSELRRLDLSYNMMNGTIPESFGQLSQLVDVNLVANSWKGALKETHLVNLRRLQHLRLTTEPEPTSEVFERLIRVVTRGRDPEYSSVEANVNSIDLSGNHLTGEIPDEITSLSSLRILNLSRNFLSNGITEKIGNLQQLESLDLSHNHLSGKIPQSLTSLASLNQLNLSYNNLSGRIPLIPKFNDSSIYEGNPLLCGAPLPTKCPDE